MRRALLSMIALVLTIAAGAQTLNVKVGSVTYQFPASQTGEMTYANGETVTIMGKTFTLTDITAMTVDNSKVSACVDSPERQSGRGNHLHAERHIRRRRVLHVGLV